MKIGIYRNMNRILSILISVIIALFTAPAIAQAADPITISYSNVILDRTSISTGQSLNVTFDMRSTGLTTSPVQPSAFLEIADQSSECEEGCGEIVTRMVSGNISQGKWSATITAGSALPSGTYRVVIWIGKLKGVSGALYYHNQSVILTNTYLPIKPTADPITISYSNVILDRTSISTGQSLNVTFDMRSTGLTTSPVQPSAFLEIADQSSECEEKCVNAVAKMVSGNISQGRWSATITADIGLPSGTYRVVIWFSKVSKTLHYHNQNVILTNTSLPIKPTADPMSEKTNNIPTAKKDTSESTLSKSKKITITCSKGKSVKKFSGANPKCPKGFKKG
jgi:hypothetical protein